MPFYCTPIAQKIHQTPKSIVMDPDSELEYEFPGGFLRLYKSGRVERFDGTDINPPSPSGDPATGVASKDVVLDPATNLSARLYLPNDVPACKKLPVVVFLHGGAFIIHSAASPLYHLYAASLAAAAPAAVVSVDYRLAPEHRLPAAYDDAFAALKWVISFCSPGGAEPWLAEHGDADRIVLAGDSAGGNMAHNALTRLGREGIDGYGNKVDGLVLMHPYFWGKEPVGTESGDASYRGGLEGTWDFVCGGKYGIDHPFVNPMASPEVWRQLGCARVLVTTADLDWFVERGRAYVEGLRRCGWEGELVHYETKGEGHVYFFSKPDCENAVKDLAAVVAFINRY